MKDSCWAFQRAVKELRKDKRKRRNRRIDPTLYQETTL